MKKTLLLTLLLIISLAGRSQLVITEVMYNPPESGTDSLEFIEIYNTSASSVDMTGYMFASGVSHTFASYVLPANGYVVLAVDSFALINTFNLTGVDVFEWNSGGLSNGGEPIALYDNLGNLVDTLRYDDATPWDTTSAFVSDGFGHSLVLCDPLSDNLDGNNWAICDSAFATGIMLNGSELIATPGTGGACGVSYNGVGPCHNLFFSEYIEGSSNNKAIEIYNPTSSSVDLSNYVVYRFNNGSPTPSDSLFPQGMIAAGDVYVISNPSIALPNVSLEDDTSHTITFYNGDDALAIVQKPTNDTLDVIGEIGVDPGSSWTVGAGATSNFTLIRMIGVNQGTTDWAIGATQWNVLPIDTEDSIGGHTMSPCGSVVNPTVNFSQPNMSVSEGVGSITIDINIVDENASPTSVDVVLNAGGSSATEPLDFTYSTTTTITFPANSNAIQSITIPIIDDSMVEGNEDFILELLNPTNSASVGVNGVQTITIVDNDFPVEPDFGNCSNLFFSEYIEGSSNNKAIEIYNPTCDSIDLGLYQIQRFNNGGTTPTSFSFNAGTYIASKGVYVVGNTGANAQIVNESDTTGNATFFNGDDALVLIDTLLGDTLDIIGVVGVDPGTSWSVGSGATSENTLVRKPNIHDGTTDWSIGETQWYVLAQDVTDSLGTHNATSCGGVLSASFIGDTSICIGDVSTFTNNTIMSSCNMSYVYDFGDGSPTSSQENPSHTYLTAGTYSVTLTVDDGNTTDDTTINVQVYDLDNASITYADTTICVGDVIDLNNVVTPTINGDAGVFSGSAGLIYDSSTGGIYADSTITLGGGPGIYTITFITDGECSDTTSVDIEIIYCTDVVEKGAGEIMLFPNPAESVVNVIGAKANSSYTVVDLSGSLVDSGQLAKGIDVSNYVAGIYIVNISNEGDYKTIKLIKK